MAPSSKATILDLASFRTSKSEKCIFCNCPEKLFFFRNQTVCLECLYNIRKLYVKSN